MVDSWRINRFPNFNKQYCSWESSGNTEIFQMCKWTGQYWYYLWLDNKRNVDKAFNLWCCKSKSNDIYLSNKDFLHFDILLVVFLTLLRLFAWITLTTHLLLKSSAETGLFDNVLMCQLTPKHLCAQAAKVRFPQDALLRSWKINQSKVLIQWSGLG